MEQLYTHANEHRYTLVVGILSARENYELRRALRNTWMTYVSTCNSLDYGVMVKFIVGSHACNFHPSLRQDEFGCQPLNVTEDFVSNRDIVITALGVFDFQLDGIKSSYLKVTLYDTVSHERVVGAIFTTQSPGLLKGNFRFRTVESYVLPKGFRGTVVVENMNSQNPALKCKAERCDIIDNGKGLVSLGRIRHGSHASNQLPVLWERYQEEIFYAAGNFMFIFPKTDDDSDVISRRSETMEKWMKAKKRETDLINQEILEFNDIVLIDEVDTYRNIPNKLVEFYDWAFRNIEFDFLLKTDDDCYVDIERIAHKLRSLELRRTDKFWWSQFRKHWPINSFGKWAELTYTASEYPMFACGSGYVLSSDLVGWLARNKDFLHRYQGEDVSMGIWLSAVNPNFIQDPGWQCNQTCYRGVYTIPENTPHQLQELFTNTENCGNPCDCHVEETNK
ncbi:UDP-GalNAc:beta-1,3-N-acetylgalactosaminyltransferase 2-like [Saccoglossus kowalevskii]|uniref:Hexosyltransferase n=1 Tax=Saccoglossus kowalevskii TaxID=10224 RepID=A0ABM0GSF5_SACKO|nr:PREDICTED: UDP-GalNAc:beta-1,3-N-acetylgalactosaminyltransferase 2-like [Saccoglossus kowalevskii]